MRRFLPILLSLQLMTASFIPNLQTSGGNSVTLTTTGTTNVTLPTSGTLATLASLTYNNHQLFTGSAPSPGTCGTSPSMGTGSVDNAGTINVGSGVSVTACTLTFAAAFTNAPACSVADDSIAVTADISAVSTMAVTFTLSATLGGGHIYYNCF